MDPQNIVKQVCEGFIIPGKSYHSELPEELIPWYVYCSDGGHCLVCCLKKDYQPQGDLIDYLLPVPVKSVMRGYSVLRGYVVVDLPYSPEYGLATFAEDDEF